MSEYEEELSQEDLKAEQTGEGLVIESTAQVIINFWRTKLHDATIGVKQMEQYRSRSRKWNKGMQPRGEVTFKTKDKKDGKQGKLTVGFNTDFYDLSDSAYAKRHDPTDLYKRISIRLFTELAKGKGGNWAGSLEQSITETISNSIAQGKPLPVFILDIPRYEYLIRLVRGRTIVGHHYNFALIPDKEWSYSLPKQVRFFSIESKKVAVGLDFNVKEIGGMNDGKAVAEVDEKKMDIGGKWVLSIKDPSLESNHVFKHVMILFCCLCKYLDEVNSQTEKLYKMVQEKGKFLDTINEELSYFRNPRYRK
ncbi:MAG: hypothetical protein ACFFCS_06300 [Candidatus Hodarchaeota archaeon]